jgi:hypothetical protein
MRKYCYDNDIDSRYLRMGAVVRSQKTTKNCTICLASICSAMQLLRKRTLSLIFCPSCCGLQKVTRTVLACLLSIGYVSREACIKPRWKGGELCRPDSSVGPMPVILTCVA